MIPIRLSILAWMIIWITTVPLFHTHLPDISAGPIAQGGLAHTVFSPDLPGEFSRASNASREDHFAHMSNRVSNRPELDFVLSFESSKDRERGHPTVLGVLCCLPDRPLPSVSTIEASTPHRQLVICTAPQAPRGPPSLVRL